MSVLSKGKQINGKYRLEHELASGGMGALWVAFDLKLRRRVAVKILHADMAASEDVRTRFEREAWAVAQIQSPYVVQTYDYGITRGVPFIVLELLEGEDLRARLLRESRLPLAEALGISTQILRGLDAVHAQGVIHRDLKPANIFLSRAAGEEVVKLLDFGVARVSGRELRRDVTLAGQIVGTPRYMSPEQVSGHHGVSARSDLWAVAVILYRVLTGEHAFPAPEVPEIMRSIGVLAVRPPTEVLSALPASFDAFIARALTRDPARRFQSATEMLQALTAVGASAAKAEDAAPDSRRRAVRLVADPERSGVGPTRLVSFPELSPEPSARKARTSGSPIDLDAWADDVLCAMETAPRIRIDDGRSSSDSAPPTLHLLPRPDLGDICSLLEPLGRTSDLTLPESERPTSPDRPLVEASSASGPLVEPAADPDPAARGSAEPFSLVIRKPASSGRRRLTLPLPSLRARPLPAPSAAVKKRPSSWAPHAWAAPVAVALGVSLALVVGLLVPDDVLVRVRALAPATRLVIQRAIRDPDRWALETAQSYASPPGASEPAPASKDADK
jgi:serine/threonine protein kinase